VGVFDSGVGGLSVLKELELTMPCADFIYFADTKNLPYGEKTPAQIINFTKDIVKFLSARGVKNVVMACNTSSALAYDVLFAQFQDIVTIHPLIQTVAKKIAAKYSHIGVLATEGTVKSLKYTEEIKKTNPAAKVLEIGCAGLVELVENNLSDTPDGIELVKSKLEPLLRANVEKIVLGCTHYPHLMPILTRFAPEAMFINPAKSLAKHVGALLNCNASACQKTTTEFWVSHECEKFINTARIFYDVKEAHLVP
jgi:glutamate racemase